MKYDITLALMFFAGCGACIALDEQDRERCVPLCTPYYYSGTTQNGDCVCDTTKEKR